jgi:hypothetical protein
MFVCCVCCVLSCRGLCDELITHPGVLPTVIRHSLHWAAVPEKIIIIIINLKLLIILRWIFRKWDVGVWTGLSWLRLETCGEHLLIR